jgi:O-antigen/teichoic acid export membrane protein
MERVNLATLGRNSLFAGLAEVWRILSRFILTPIIIGVLGMDGYGVWALVFSVAAYVSMVNASFGAAYVKFTAECVRTDDHDRLSRILGSGMAGIGTVALLGVLGAYVLGAPILRGLNTPSELMDDARWALVIVMICLVLRMTVGCTLEVLAGLQRIDLTYRLYIVASILEFCVSLPLLLTGHGLVGLAIGHGVGQVTIDVAAWWLVRKHAPRIRISPFLISRDGLRAVFSIGGKFQLLSFVNTLVMQGVKFLLAALIGPRWVGIYELADKLVNLGRSVSASIVAPLMPAFADLQAGLEAARERRLFLRGSKALAVVGSAAFTFLAVFSSPAILAWTGAHVAEAAWALRVLAPGEIAILLTGVVSANLRARGRVGLELSFALVSTCTMLLLVGPALSLFGFEGVICARMVSQLLGSAWYLRAYARFAGLGFAEYFRGVAIGRIVLVIGSVGTAILVGSRALGVPGLAHLPERGRAALTILTWAVPYGAMVLLGVWHLVCSTQERRAIATLLDRVRPKRG